MGARGKGREFFVFENYKDTITIEPDGFSDTESSEE
jgi:hypothetical protein